MIVLGIESSCDETSVALVENGKNVIGELTFSQIDTHRKFGGVVPEIAAREHLTFIDEAIWTLLEDSQMPIEKIDRVAVVNGPGLVSSLLVGVTAAKVFAWSCKSIKDIELVNVNHLKAHICANFLETESTKKALLEPPFICLLASGGHTQLILVKSYAEMELLGETLDDSAGEAFDKTARLLGLNYPGGPEIEKLAETGSKDLFSLPKPKVGKYEFSFSGLKTAALRLIQKLETEGKLKQHKADVASSFQQVVCDSLAEKLLLAAQEHKQSKIVIAGGVAANKTLKRTLENLMKKNSAKDADCDFELFYPSLKYCTDNGAMVASAGYFCPERFGNDFSVYSRAA